MTMIPFRKKEVLVEEGLRFLPEKTSLVEEELTIHKVSIFAEDGPKWKNSSCSGSSCQSETETLCGEVKLHHRSRESSSGGSCPSSASSPT